MKGQQEVLSVVLISGILIGVVGSVYFWGVPLVQKNKDVAILEGSENFMKTLNNKIKYVANNGGRDQLSVNVPGIIKFDGMLRTISLIVDTEGTIYSVDSPIPLGRNSDCSAINGKFGIADPEITCVTSKKIAENRYQTNYVLKYVLLENQNIIKDYVINLQGNTKTGGEQSTIIFENLGVSEEKDPATGRTTIKTLININIV